MSTDEATPAEKQALEEEVQAEPVPPDPEPEVEATPESSCRCFTCSMSGYPSIEISAVAANEAKRQYAVAMALTVDQLGGIQIKEK